MRIYPRARKILRLRDVAGGRPPLRLTAQCAIKFIISFITAAFALLPPGIRAENIFIPAPAPDSEHCTVDLILSSNAGDSIMGIEVRGRLPVWYDLYLGAGAGGRLRPVTIFDRIDGVFFQQKVDAYNFPLLYVEQQVAILRGFGVMCDAGFAGNGSDVRGVHLGDSYTLVPLFRAGALYEASLFACRAAYEYLPLQYVGDHRFLLGAGVRL